MEQRMFTAETPFGLETKVNRMLDEGWRWVDGGGSVATHKPGRLHCAPPPMVGGFWAVLERESERPPAGFVKHED